MKAMQAERLKAARRTGGWTQAEAALRLGVSQPYYAQLESGARPVPGELALTAVRKLGLSPVALPLPELAQRLTRWDPDELAAQLAWLGYKGFAQVKKTSRPANPAAVVAGALAHEDLDVRLVEALPWVLAVFHELDWGWLTAQCRLGNLQNRLGYVVTLAMKLGRPGAATALGGVLVELERSRLAAEGTLCRERMSAAERKWTREHRSSEAAHWRLLTTLTAEQLTHAA